MAGMIPPLDMDVNMRANTPKFVCCCGRVRASNLENGRVVYDSGSDEFTIKSILINIFSNIQCCVRGKNPDVEEEKNEQTYEKLDQVSQKYFNQTAEEVEEVLHLSTEKTEGMPMAFFKQVFAWAEENSQNGDFTIAFRVSRHV